MTYVILALIAVAGLAVGAAVIGFKRAKKQRIRADRLELTLNATNADIARKNAALDTIADNMERLKDEKSRIAKSDLDGLIAHARELSDMPGVITDGGNSASAETTIPGTLIK